MQTCCYITRNVILSNLLFQVVNLFVFQYLNLSSSTMPLQLYHFHISPPSRSVLMTLKALGIDFEVKPVNLFEGEQKKTEYLKINPRGKVPALMDGNVNVYER